MRNISSPRKTGARVPQMGQMLDEFELAELRAEALRFRAKRSTLASEDSLAPGSYRRLGLEFTLAMRLMGASSREASGHASRAGHVTIARVQGVPSGVLRTGVFAIPETQSLRSLDAVKLDDGEVAIVRTSELAQNDVFSRMPMRVANRALECEMDPSDARAWCSAGVGIHWDATEDTVEYTQLESLLVFHLGWGAKLEMQVTLDVDSGACGLDSGTLSIELTGEIGVGYKIDGVEQSFDDIVIAAIKYPLLGARFSLCVYQIGAEVGIELGAFVRGIKLTIPAIQHHRGIRLSAGRELRLTDQSRYIHDSGWRTELTPVKVNSSFERDTDDIAIINDRSVSVPEGMVMVKELMVWDVVGLVAMDESDMEGLGEQADPEPEKTKTSDPEKLETEETPAPTTPPNAVILYEVSIDPNCLFVRGETNGFITTLGFKIRETDRETILYEFSDRHDSMESAAAFFTDWKITLVTTTYFRVTLSYIDGYQDTTVTESFPGGSLASPSFTIGTGDMANTFICRDLSEIETSGPETSEPETSWPVLSGPGAKKPATGEPKDSDEYASLTGDLMTPGSSLYQIKGVSRLGSQWVGKRWAEGSLSVSGFDKGTVTVVFEQQGSRYLIHASVSTASGSSLRLPSAESVLSNRAELSRLLKINDGDIDIMDDGSVSVAEEMVTVTKLTGQDIVGLVAMDESNTESLDRNPDPEKPKTSGPVSSGPTSSGPVSSGPRDGNESSNAGLIACLSAAILVAVVVTVVGVNAFCWSSLRRLAVPDGVKRLGDGCFCQCKSLEAVDFGAGSRLVTIGERAFQESSLRRLAVPDGVDRLGDACFSVCELLEAVEEEDSEEDGNEDGDEGENSEEDGDEDENSKDDGDEDEDESGEEDENGEEDGGEDEEENSGEDGDEDEEESSEEDENGEEDGEEDEDENSGYRGREGRTFLWPAGRGLADWNWASDACGSRALGTVLFPDATERLGAGCFSWCGSLESVDFGAGSRLIEIGVMAFYKSSLRRLAVPDRVERLGDECFSWCDSLESVDFGAGSRLIEIGVMAFHESSLRRLAVPDGVERLGIGCFSECKSLEAVDFGAGSRLVVIGKEAFSRSSLRCLAVPDGVERLGVGCFS